MASVAASVFARKRQPLTTKPTVCDPKLRLCVNMLPPCFKCRIYRQGMHPQEKRKVF